MKISRREGLTSPQIPEDIFEFNKKDPTVIKKFVKPVEDLVIPKFVTRIVPNAFGKKTPIRYVKSLKIENPNLAGIREILAYLPDAADVEVPDDFVDLAGLYWGSSAYRRSAVADALRSNSDFVIQSKTLVKYLGEDSSVVIPDSVIRIGDAAFSGCTSLTNVTIPDSVTEIGRNAFRGCTSLKQVTIPDSVTSMGYEAFAFCYALTSVTIPDSVTRIEERTFSYCESLKSVTIPNSVKYIGVYAFSDCPSLTRITIPDSVTEIAWSAFEYCKSLQSVTIPDSVTYIGTDAFFKCPQLTVITDNEYAQEYCDNNNIPWQPDSTITTM